MIDVNEILNFLIKNEIDFEYEGFDSLYIHNFSSMKNPKHNAITWIKQVSTKKLSLIPTSYNMLIVANRNDNIDKKGYNLILCDDPKATFFSILKEFWGEIKPRFIAKSAIIETENIGNNVSVGHHCYIGPEVEIDDEVRIYHNVVILGKVTIGKRTIINSGTVIGSDGFGYFKNSDGANIRVEHFGGVVIGDDVEIGANTCIDRGTLDNTIIGNNCKIDNLCHIGHNCILEEGVTLIALSQLGGSSHLKRQAHIAPSVTIMNQISIGENSLVGLGSVVTKDVPDNKVVIGVPAKVIRDNK